MKYLIKNVLKKKYKYHVIYLHLPKTGGNTIRQIFQNNYKITNRLYFKSDMERQKDFEKMCKSQNQFGNFTSGHIYYGYHKLLPEGVPFKYYIMLRDPISRIISQYNYIVSGQSGHWLEEHRNNLSFSEYIRSKLDRDIDNMQTRRTAGIDYHFDKYPFGSLNKNCIKDAISNIKNDFFTPGILSNFDKSILTAKKEFNLKYCYYKTKNITNKTINSITINDITKKDIKFLRELNEYDYKLYDFCCELNKKNTSNISKNKLNYFRLTNKIINTII